MKILIKDLSEGIHEFREDIPVGDIELPEPEFYPHSLVLDLYIDRLDNIYRLKVKISTQAKYSCDRCLEEFDSEFSASAEQIYQLGSGKLDDDDEVEILPADTRELNIDKVIQDVFIMSRPIQMLCSESCNGLCAICGINLNEKQCKCKTDHIDPRLEKLKSLLN
jgi:uncharacterized protein